MAGAVGAMAAPSSAEAAGRVVRGVDPDLVVHLLEQYALPTAKALVLVVLGYLASAWARRVVLRALGRVRLDLTLARFLANLARWLILALVGVAVLGMFGVQTASFAALLAAAGLAMGLAFQGSLSNMAAGVMLLVFRPFRVGDVISAAGVVGTVDEIQLFTTTLDTADNRRLFIPNSAIVSSTIENISFHPTRRVEVLVGTDYAADLDRTREVLLAAARAVSGRDASRDPVVYLDELGTSSIQWKVRIWCPTREFWAVREALTRGIKLALDEAGINIPFPQRTVHVPATVRARLDRLDDI